MQMHSNHGNFFSTAIEHTQQLVILFFILFLKKQYPFVSKCGYIGQLELQPKLSNHSNEVKLDNFPGGPETFEMILKFCYGLPVDLDPNNIAPLRCASEFLEMTEELEAGNLISKTESFLTLVVLSSWQDTITVLKSCKTLSPWAENLQIVRRCCDSIAWKASRENTSKDADGEQWWLREVATFRIDHYTKEGYISNKSKEFKARVYS